MKEEISNAGDANRTYTNRPNSIASPLYYLPGNILCSCFHFMLGNGSLPDCNYIEIFCINPVCSEQDIIKRVYLPVIFNYDKIGLAK